MNNREIILASASPRRRELLGNMGFSFKVVPADIDESRLSQSETPCEYVRRLSLSKAEKILSLHPDAVIVGVDTTVSMNNEIFGKPADFEEFHLFMSKLSGKTHQVFTGLSVIDRDRTVSSYVKSDVTFVEMSEKDISDYWATGEPVDKAGGYAIQGIGGSYIKCVSGSVSSIIGLPQVELRIILNSFMEGGIHE